MRRADGDYIVTLQQHLADYKTRTLGVQDSGTWGTPPRAYPHILPKGHRRLNIVQSLREPFWREHARRAWHLHQFFHHLSSSQALAFNLFFGLYPNVPSSFVATRRLLLLPPDAPCRLDFEVVLDPIEGTNIDVLIEDAEGTRTIIEVKLTEGGFGQAKTDARHLHKLRDIYRPRLAGQVDVSCLEPAVFCRDYQLYRNLAQIRRERQDRVLLLLPRARPTLWRHAQQWCAASTLGHLLGRISPVALEDVLRALVADAMDSNALREAVAEVVQKYQLAEPAC